jgi:hypothetical protein
MEKKGNKSSLRYKNPNIQQRASNLAGSPGIQPGRKRDEKFNSIFLGESPKDGDSSKKNAIQSKTQSAVRLFSRKILHSA